MNFITHSCFNLLLALPGPSWILSQTAGTLSRMLNALNWEPDCLVALTSLWLYSFIDYILSGDAYRMISGQFWFVLSLQGKG